MRYILVSSFWPSVHFITCEYKKFIDGEKIMDKLFIMKEKIEELRQELDKILISEKSANSTNVLKVSEKLDERIVKYMRELDKYRET